jgi:hypothetical protein
MPRIPFEADPPLIVDPDAPLACSIPAQLLQMVADRDAQISKISGSIQLLQFHQGAALNAPR